MKIALRTLAGSVAGLAVALLLVIAVELFGAVVHPFPEGFGGTTEEVCRHVERYPQWVLAVAAAAWGVTAYAGVWVAQRVGNLFAGGVVAALLVAAVVFNVSMLPYPVWFKAAAPIAVLAAALAGLVGASRTLSATSEDPGDE